MKLLKWVCFSVSTLLFTCIATCSFSQSQTEVRFTKGVNPKYPSNFFYKTFSSTAKPAAIAIPLGMLAVALINDNKQLENEAYETVAGIAIAAIGTEAIKVIIQRQRPYETYADIYPDEIDNGNAFPSGHTSVAFAAATSITLISKKWYLAVPAYAWASGVGYSRIYLGQHYPSDVAAGAIVGATGAYASHWLNKKFFSGKKKKKVSQTQ